MVNSLWGATPSELHADLVGSSINWQHGQWSDLNREQDLLSEEFES